MNQASATPADNSQDRAHRPGLILLVRPAGGPPVQVHTGLACLEFNTPIRDDTAFNVGSVAKQITAYLLVRAARDGLLDLDRPVDGVLPRFQIPNVRIGELIQHRGGIRDTESLLALAGFRDLDHYTAADLLELAYRQDRRAVEPSRFLYSNTGYLLLAEVLHHVHGTDLQDIADQQIFTPLGMTSTRFKSDPRQVVPGAAASYEPITDGWRHQQRPVTLPGPGSMWCTATDLNRWLDHLSHEWNLSPHDQLPFERHIDYRLSNHHPFTYGAGLYADPRPTSTAVFHYGHEQGFSAATHLTRSNQKIVCLSNHTHIAADHVIATVLKDIARVPDAELLLIRALTAQKEPVPVVATSPQKADHSSGQHTTIGTYTCNAVPGVLRLTFRNGELYLWRRGTPDRLVRTGPTTYTSDGYTLTIKSAEPELPDPPRGFILDLARAPDLHYRLFEDYSR